MPEDDLSLSVVLPARNEAPGIVRSLCRIEQVLLANAIEAEVIVVDDSDDGTAQIVERERFQVPVSVIHRDPGKRDGLSGAVKLGFRRAHGRYLAVMDADMQHPPEELGALLAAAGQGADVVVATRFRPGGSADGLSSGGRKLVSHASRWLAKAFFPRRLRGISDPLSGFFLVDRRVIADADLKSAGFKILLEVLLRGQWSASREVPYKFEARLDGRSKASTRQGWAFGVQLGHLMVDRALGRLPTPRPQSLGTSLSPRADTEPQ